LYLFRGQSTGAIVYAAVFVAIIIWSFYEADGSVWALLPRLFGPAILMALVVLVAPRLEQPLFGPGVAVVVVLGLLPAGASTVLF